MPESLFCCFLLWLEDLNISNIDLSLSWNMQILVKFYKLSFYFFSRKNTFINNNTYWNTYINSTCNTQPKKEKENENQTMTPLSKCLYKEMKIDPLDRFLEGKINICLYYRYGIKAIKSINKNKLDHEKIFQVPAASRNFFYILQLILSRNTIWK